MFYHVVNTVFIETKAQILSTEQSFSLHFLCDCLSHTTVATSIMTLILYSCLDWFEMIYCHLDI